MPTDPFEKELEDDEAALIKSIGDKLDPPDESPVHVLLDTNSLHSAFVGESSIAFRALSDLAARDQIFLHLPEVVLQEVRSQVSGWISGSGIDKVQACFKELRKLTPLQQRASLNEVERLLDVHTTGLAQTINTRIDQWLADAKVKVHGIDLAHTAKVFTAYFAGSAPFKTIKSREDFPDAFIWQVLNDLAQNARMHFVCKDTAMSKCCEQLAATVTVHADINRLLQSGCLPIHATQNDLNLARKCEGALIEIEWKARSLLSGALERLHFKATNMATVAVDGTMQIESVLDIVESKIDPGSIAPIGGGSLMARFSALVVVRVSYDLTGGLPGTFNILERSSVQGDYDLTLSGSLLLKPVFSANVEAGSGKPVLETVRFGLEDVDVETCKPHLQGQGADKEIDDTRVCIRYNDQTALSRALARCCGFIVITGRRKRQKVRAAESLFREVAIHSPEKFLLTTYRTPGFIRMGCLPLPGSGEAMNIRRPSLSTENVWNRLAATDPDGLVVDTNDKKDFDFADAILSGHRILIIGIADFRDIGECRREFDALPFEPSAILEAS